MTKKHLGLSIQCVISLLIRILFPSIKNYKVIDCVPPMCHRTCMSLALQMNRNTDFIHQPIMV